MEVNKTAGRSVMYIYHNTCLEQKLKTKPMYRGTRHWNYSIMQLLIKNYAVNTFDHFALKELHTCSIWEFSSKIAYKTVKINLKIISENILVNLGPDPWRGKFWKLRKEEFLNGQTRPGGKNARTEPDTKKLKEFYFCSQYFIENFF